MLSEAGPPRTRKKCVSDNGTGICSRGRSALSQGQERERKKINGVEDALETLFQKSEEMAGTINPMRETMTV